MLKLERLNSNYIEYGKKQTDYLKKRDPKLGEIIERTGTLDYCVISDLFEALVNNIIGQQISTKALVTIWERTLLLCGKVTPQKILSLGDEELQSVGISMRKVSYIKDAAKKVTDGSFDIEQVCSLADDELCEKLSTLKGVGKWTAEMLMIFSLRRENILSYDDLGIRRGLSVLHGIDELSREVFEEYRQLYAPYCTVAGLYLWQVK